MSFSYKSMTLTPSAVSDLSKGKIHECVMQVLNVKQIASQDQQLRYRLILSDGIQFSHAMVATQLNHFFNNDKVKKNAILRITSNAH
jgi:hypothetical protein